MNPIDFPQAFRTLGAPGGSGDVAPLRVWTDEHECVSCWLPNADELRRLASGEPVYLRVLSGGTQPPVLLEVGSPFVKESALTGLDVEVLRAAGIEP